MNEKNRFKEFEQKKDYIKFKEIYLLILALLIFPMYLVGFFVVLRVLTMSKKFDRLVEKLYYRPKVFAYFLLVIAITNVLIALGRIEYIFNRTKNGLSLNVLPRIYDNIFFYGTTKMFSSGIQLIGAFLLLSIVVGMLFACWGSRNYKWTYFPKAEGLVRAMFGARLPIYRVLNGEVFEEVENKDFVLNTILPIVYKFISLMLLWFLMKKVGEYYVLFVPLTLRNCMDFIITVSYWGLKRTIIVIIAIVVWIKLRIDNYC